MKQNLNKLIITIIGLLLLIVILYFFNQGSLNKAGTVEINVIDAAGNIVIDEEVKFIEKQSLKDILEENYDVEIRNGFLVQIEDVYADGEGYFIKIWVNCQMASYGVENLYFADGDIVHLVHTKVDDFNAPC